MSDVDVPKSREEVRAQDGGLRSPHGDRVPKRRRLARLAKRFAIAALLLAIVARIALPFALPHALARIGASRGLAIRYDELQLAILHGRMSLAHLDVRPLAADGESAGDAPEALLHVDHADFDLDVLALLAGELRVRRAVADGIAVRIERDASGEWALERHLAGAPGERDARRREEAGDEGLDFAPPLRVDVARLHGLRVHLVDHGRATPLDAVLHLDAGISDLGHPERAARLRVEARSDAFLDRLHVTGELAGAPRELDAKLALGLAGFRPEPLAAWLAEVGLEPLGAEIDAGAAVRIAVRPLVSPEGSERDADAASARVEVTGAFVRAGAETAIALDELTLEVPRVEPRRIIGATCVARGLRGRAQRLPDGALAVAGFALRSPPPAAATGRAPEVEEPAGGREAGDAAAAPAVLELARLAIEGAELSFDDASVAPPAKIAVNPLTLSLTDLVLDPARPDGECALTVRARVADVAEELALDVAARPFAERATISASFRAEGIDGTAVAGYLAPLGLAPDFGGGRAEAAIDAWLELAPDGGARAEVEVTGVAVEPGGGELASRIARCALLGFELADGGDTLRVAELSIEGPTLALRRDAEGSLRVLGLRTIEARERGADVATGASSPDASAPAASGTGAPDRRAASPRLELARAAIEGAALRFDDPSASPPAHVAVDARFELTGLALGGPASRTEPDVARIDASLSAEGLADRIALTGSIASRPGPLDVDLALALEGDGLVGDLVAPLLDARGVGSTLSSGALRARAELSARETASGLELAARVEEVSLRDGDLEWLGLDELSLDRLLLQPRGEAGPGAIRAGTLALVRPRAHVRRDADGALCALGLRLRPSGSGAVAVEEVRGTGGGTAAAGAGAPEPSRHVASERGATPPVLSLERLVIDAGAIEWSDFALAAREQPGDAGDAAIAPPVETRATLDAELASLRIGEPGPPATLGVELSLAGALERLAVEGSAELAGDSRAVALAWSASGMRAGPLAAYAPAGIDVTWRDGSFSGRIEASDRPASEGGRDVDLLVADVELRDGADGEPLAKLGALELDARRLDPAARVFELASLESRDVELALARTGPRTLEAGGIAWTRPEPPERPDAPPIDPSPAPIAEGSGAPAPSAEVPALVVGFPGVVGDALPAVTVDALSVGVDRLRYRDETSPDAAPFAAEARLTLLAPARLIGPEPESLPPLRCELFGSAPPFVDACRVAVTAAPFAPSASLAVELDATGLDGAALVASFPELGAKVDGGGLAGGSLHARFDATLEARRRGPAAFDLSHGLAALLTLEELALRAVPDGPIELGVERVLVDAPRMRPAIGRFDIETVEITRPIARARRSALGLHVAGLTLKAPPAPVEESGTPTEVAPSAAEGPAPADNESAPAVDEPAPAIDERAPAVEEVGAGAEGAEATGPPPELGPSLRIASVLVSGADLAWVDDSVEPPLRVPIVDLDVEARNLSTDGAGAPLTIRAYVEAGEVALPERSSGDSLVSGLLAAAAGAVTGADDDYELEQRPLWDSLRVDGRIDLGAEPPRGFVTLEVAEFELPALRGPAAASGIDIADGLMDTRATVRLLGERGIRIESRTVFSKLFVSEPSGGPISKYLALPAPLDTVLYVLRDENEQQVIPLSLSLPESGVSTASVLAEVGAVLGQMIAEAIASSPLRIGGGIVGLLGLTDEEEAAPAGPPLDVEFAPLDPRCDEAARGALSELARTVSQIAERELVLVHELGARDVAEADRAATFDEASLRELGAYLRASRDGLLVARAERAAAARGEYAVGRLSEAERERAALVEIDRRLHETESAMDQVFGLLRSSSARASERRARAVALLIGEARLAAVKEALVEAGMPSTRIDVRRARASRSSEVEVGRVRVEQR